MLHGDLIVWFIQFDGEKNSAKESSYNLLQEYTTASASMVANRC